MSIGDADIRCKPISRPRARARAALVAGVAGLLASGPAFAGGWPASDTDCDGVVDASDDCRAGAEDRDGHDDGDGCPDGDNDRDRIADDADRCPDEAEDVNGVEDEDGCPDRAVELRTDRIEIEQRIHFAFDRAEILPRSHLILREAAEAVRAHPEIAVIRVEGHADDQGAIGYDLKLSERSRFYTQGRPACRPVWPAASERAGRTGSLPGGGGPPGDRRGVNRRVLYDDRAQAASARARPELDGWTATLVGGFEF